MVLRRGITGLQYQDFKPTDEKAFKSMCYEMCHEVGYRLVATDFGAIARSFYAVKIESSRGTPFFVLLHVNYNLICFASTIQPFNVRFINETECMEFFESKGFTVLSSTYLDTPFELSAANDLPEAEMKDIRYWKPKTFGELIFNFWD